MSVDRQKFDYNGCNGLMAHLIYLKEHEEEYIAKGKSW